ncbi:MFS transporter, partial [Francisella tularensis subsp. holarctica]|uniref:MFS transporter n=1 Tax=Francisella tularensis TaxID=263 RepID=UPI002381BFB1
KNEGSLLSILTKRHNLMPMFIVFSVAMIDQMTGINSILQYAPTKLKETGLVSVYAAIVGGLSITGLNFETTIIEVVIA